MDRKAAKKARNIAEHAARNSLRKGRQHQATIKANAKFVTDSLSGPNAMILNHWLKGREATFARVRRFFDERPQLQPLPATEKAA